MLIPRAVSQRTLWSPGSNLSPGASKEAISFACSTPPHAPIRASRSLGFAIGRERSSRAARTCGAWTYPDPADATRRVTADRENRPAVACSRVDARSLGSRSSGGFTGEIFRGETRSIVRVLPGHRLTLTLTQSSDATRRVAVGVSRGCSPRGPRAPPPGAPPPGRARGGAGRAGRLRRPPRAAPPMAPPRRHLAAAAAASTFPSATLPTI